MPGEPTADEWFDACRRIVAAQRELFARTVGIAARTEYAGISEGGDRSLVIDRQSEEIAFTELQLLHDAGAEFTAISEERGEVEFGDGLSETRVVIDPIDGSLNARRTMPSFALSIAVASGPSMADVEVAFVHDFGSGEEFTAERHDGARCNGEPIQAIGPGYGLELVGLEASKPELIAPLVDGLRGNAFRIRALGSMALTLCYVAAGRLDGMIAARPTRSVDVAAAQMIVGEAGGVLKFDKRPLDEVRLDLAARYDLAAALDEEMLGTLLRIQRGALKARTG
jgi:myo-inositol-1(or 4)-monophosphatase